MDIYFLRPNRLVIEAQNASDREALPELYRTLQELVEMIKKKDPSTDVKFQEVANVHRR